MNESKSKNEKPQEARRFSQEQYDMLKCCSDKKDTTEWNERRKQHPEEDIWLQGRNFHGWYLKDVILRKFIKGSKGEVYLEGANFSDTDLRGGKFNFAHLQNSNFTDARLESAIFYWAHLEGANFRTTVVDGCTSFWKCHVDLHTDFRGVGLNSCRIDSLTRQPLEYNIRRKNWEEWYKEHWLLRWPVRWFWCLSNYGISTWRVIVWFFGLALFFAAIYANFACWYPPGIVSDLTVEPHLPLWHYFLLLSLRPIYFSVVTMTTLGFGDMYANAQSIWGHILLTVQVILGYVLLGALVTRFAVLFTAGGPAGKFADEKGEKDETE